MTDRTIAGVMLALVLAMASAPAAAVDRAQPAMPYDGLKKTVSVDQFLATEAVGGSVTGDGMTALLTAALVKDGRFVVVDYETGRSARPENRRPSRPQEFHVF